MREESFARGAFTLMLAGMISKFLGAFYRMPLARIIGDEGMGLYEMAYPIYSLLLIMAVAGFPVAISKLISEHRATRAYEEEKAVFFNALVVLCLTGVIFSFILYNGAGFIASHVLGDVRVIYPLKYISPAIFLVSIMSGFRGFFQGYKIMTPTALSQTSEQFFRVISMLFFGYIFKQAGVEYGAAGATLGAAVGALFGLLILITIFIKEKGINFFINLFISIAFFRNLKKSIYILKQLLKIAVPFSLGALVMPLMQTVDAAVVPQRLQLIGYSISEATSLYGHLSGMALRLVSLPTIFTLALGTSLVPVLSSYQVKGCFNRINKYIVQALRLTIIVGIPASAGIFIMAFEMTDLLFGYYEAGAPLRVMSFAALFLCLQQVTSFILQGLGFYQRPVINLLVGACVNFILNYNLTACPSLGILGAALGTGCGFFTASLLNLRDIYKRVDISFPFLANCFKPIISTLVMVFFLLRFSSLIGEFFYGLRLLSFLCELLIAGFVYFLALLVLKGLDENDILWIPGLGPALTKILKALRLL